MSYQSWTAADPAETPVLTLDLAALVTAQGGGTITAATVAASVWRGEDANPGAIIQGGVDFSASPKVKIRKAAGGTAEAYLITVTATLSTGPVVVGSAILPIQEGGA